jgi:predicted membrane-bound spermidine synthase
MSLLEQHISPRRLFAIVFIEGFCSLGAEVIALRQVIPHMGSSIVITAPTIGFFLLALALGYHAGARVHADFARVVARNFVIAALLCAAGLAGASVDWIFVNIDPPEAAYLVFIACVLCPLSYLMGQTVPVLTNLLRHERAGEKSGYALFHSTLGSFLGSLTLSLVLMQFVGVAFAVAVCTAALLAGAVLLGDTRLRGVAIVSLAAVALPFVGRGPDHVAATAYADYAVAAVEREGLKGARAFFVNNSTASIVDESEPPKYARYIRHIRGILLDSLAFKGKEILVLGAGGFTLSHREPENRYTYVDVDPDIRKIAETRFLKESALGEFIVADARSFVTRTERRFDAILVDTYSAHFSIPGHLVTREFWLAVQKPLKPDGVLIANLLLDGKLASDYSRNLLATIESVWGRCAVEVLHKSEPIANVVVTCFNPPQARPPNIYVDERNAADFDIARTRH